LKILVLDGLMVVGQISVMLYHSARLTLALFVLAPPVALVVWYVGRRYRRISRRVQSSVGSITGMVDEVVNGQREVRIYGGRDYERSRFDTVNDGIRRLNLKIAATNSLANAVVQFVAALALALVIFLATRPGAILRQMSPGTFMSLITAMLVMLPSLKRLTTVQAAMQRGVVAARVLFLVVDTPA
jgi:subfamily B ATP-binding cassette protein MsbA